MYWLNPFVSIQNPVLELIQNTPNPVFDLDFPKEITLQL